MTPAAPYLAPPIACPFRVAIDQREKAPYHFAGLKADARHKRAPLDVSTEWAHLLTGDYSIVGHEERIAIERKSLEDLYSTLGQHRERFERAHERMAELEYAAVVVEASWDRILNDPPWRSQLRPKTVARTAMSWSIKYGVPWFTVDGRRLGEVWTFRLLERWWMKEQKAESEKTNAEEDN